MPEMSDHLEPPGGTSGNFGDELRKEREIRGITLKEIADATKISKRFLEAIEKNDFKTLPAPIFTRGFIREYSRYLGLPADDMLNRYAHFVRQAEEEENAPLKTGPVPVLQTRPISNIPQSYARFNPGIIFTFILLAVLAAALWFFLLRRPATYVAATPSLSPAAEPAVVRSASAAGAGGVPVETLSLRLDLTENSWISLEADGKSVLNEELGAAESKTFTANDSFRLRTVGNAGGVTMTLNGTKLPPLGASGEVVKNRVVDRSALTPAASSDNSR